MPLRATMLPTITYPGGASRYFSDRSRLNGVWIALITTVILSYSPQSHSGITLRNIDFAFKRTLNVEDWCSPPGFLRATILKVLKKLPVFIASPLQEGQRKGDQLWRFDSTRNVDVPEDLLDEMTRLARVTRKRWHLEALSRYPTSLRRILKELQGSGTTRITTGNQTVPNQARVQLALDSSQTPQKYGEHVRRFSAPAVAGSYSRRPLSIVDTNIAEDVVPSEGLWSAPGSPGQGSNPPLNGSVDCQVERQDRIPPKIGRPRPEEPSSPTGMAVSGVGSPGRGENGPAMASQSARNSSVLSPSLSPNLSSLTPKNTNTSKSGATLFLPSPSPDRAVRKASKRQREDDEEYRLSDSPSSDGSGWSSSFDCESDFDVYEPPPRRQDKRAVPLLLSLTRAGAEFGPPIMLGHGSAEQQSSRDSSTRIAEDNIGTGASSSKRKLDDSDGRRTQARRHKLRITTSGTAAPVIAESSRRAIQLETAEKASPIHQDTLAGEEEEILNVLVNIFNRGDGPKRVLEEGVIWRTFHQEMSHVTRKAYSRVLTHDRRFARANLPSSVSGSSSEHVQFYRYVPS